MLLTTRMVAKIVRPDIALGSAVRTEGVANTFVSTKLPAPIRRAALAAVRENPKTRSVANLPEQNEGYLKVSSDLDWFTTSGWEIFTAEINFSRGALPVTGEQARGGSCEPINDTFPRRFPPKRPKSPRPLGLLPSGDTRRRFCARASCSPPRDSRTDARRRWTIDSRLFTPRNPA